MNDVPATEPPPASSAEQSFAFGSLRLFPGQRLLFDGDKPVRLGSRALDILTVLVEHAGRVVPKEELIARVWPNVFVDESNLKIQVSALRRAVGDGQGGVRYIVTVPGRGYEFVAPVKRTEEHPASTPPAAAKAANHNLPAPVTRMIGRDEAVTALVSRLSGERLVTIVGPGGIGKTTLALAVAESMLAAFADGVWLIDLAPLTDRRLVPSTVATVLGLEIHTDDPLPGLVASLAGKRLLLILDNCEHVADAAAGLATALLRGAPGISMLATSREPLGIAGERDYRLGPLAMPQPLERLSAADAMAFPAVQLLVERAGAVVEDFALIDADTPHVVEICRRLDGLPLAIEFAAARVQVLGIRGLAANLDDSLQGRGGWRRSVMPRHRTIWDLLDWSYGLLTENEKQFFRRLGIFSGNFSIEAAATVTIVGAPPPADALDLLADMVAKSLLAADVSGAEPRFRLLETTRAYVLERLGESGERNAIARAHAEYYRDLIERAETDSERQPTVDWLVEHATKVDNLRAALDWAFSPDGDSAIGVALAAAAVPLWMHLSLVEECRAWAAQALASLATTADKDARREMRLQAALATSLMSGRGARHQISAAWTAVLRIAENLDAAEYQSRALRGLWSFHDAGGECRIAMGLARRFRMIATTRSDTAGQLVGDRLIGMSQLRLGHLASARRRLERFLTNYAIPDQRQHFQADQRVAARAFLARLLWLQGYADQAMRAAQQSIDDAQETRHTYSLCFARAHAAWIALTIGDCVAAEPLIGRLIDLSTSNALTHWHAWGRGHEGELAIKRGDVVTGLSLLHAGLAELGQARSGLRYGMFLVRIAPALAQAGLICDGLAAIEEALAWVERVEERSVIAELLRIKGNLLLLQAAPAAAEGCLWQALDWARRQGALSWELRAATSLAQLWRDQGRSSDAKALLQPVYDRFTEGFDTTDLIAGKRLLDEMNDVPRD